MIHDHNLVRLAYEAYVGTWHEPDQLDPIGLILVAMVTCLMGSPWYRSTSQGMFKLCTCEIFHRYYG